MIVIVALTNAAARPTLDYPKTSMMTVEFRQASRSPGNGKRPSSVYVFRTAAKGGCRESLYDQTVLE